MVRINGWSRKKFYHDCSSSFVPNSPAMANAESYLLYPRLFLAEATNLSEGMRTPQSFRVRGSPWLCAMGIAAAELLLDQPRDQFRKTMERLLNCQEWALSVGE